MPKSESAKSKSDKKESPKKPTKAKKEQKAEKTARTNGPKKVEKPNQKTISKPNEKQKSSKKTDQKNKPKPAQKPQLTEKPKTPKKNREENKAKNEEPRFTQNCIRNIMTRANPEMNISAGVPNLVNSAAVQFATYLSQTALENSLKGKRGEDHFNVSYNDVAVSVNADPRLEALHESVPYQITVEEALKRRQKFLKLNK